MRESPTRSYESPTKNYDSSFIEQQGLRHQLGALQKLARKYNKKNPGQSIDLNDHKTIDRLIFALWSREVDPEVLGFGYPYDELRKFAVFYDDDDIMTNIDENPLYVSYINSDKIPDFLCYTLLLPKKFGNGSTSDDKFTQNLNEFNELLATIEKKPVRFLEDCREMLKGGSLSNLDLCYLLWESEELYIYRDGMGTIDFFEVVSLS